MTPDVSRLSVLWATDGSDAARKAMPLLRALVLPAAARLIILTVVPHTFLSGARPDPAFLLKAAPGAKRKALLEGEELAQEEATLLDPSGVSVEAISRWGNPIEEILKAARTRSADLMVLGAKGHSNLGLMLVGSVSQGIVQHATKPVLIVRPGSENTNLKEVVVGYQGSPAARRAVAFLERLALPGDTYIHLVDVIEPFGVPAGTPVSYRKRAMEEAHEINEHRHHAADRRLSVLAQRLGQSNHRVDTEVLAGDPGPELDEAAKRHNAGLIVVGSRKADPLRHYLLGSTAEKLVRHAHTSVLVVR
jgi:nucleotide-binding universal stress UspA family protein